MPPALHDLASLLRCPRCRAAEWSAILRDREAILTCACCGARYRSDDGVLDLSGPDEDPLVDAERRGVHLTERNPALGGIDAEFDDLATAEGTLRDAILALPYGNDSRYYLEPGYFANVRESTAAFDFVVQRLDAREGECLLDLGADLTWSTCHMARRGLQCTALDINHHLSVGRLFAGHYGVAYNLVRADMRRVTFRDGAFDVVLAVNALHHAACLEEVAANIARMLRPGGRLGFIEPYCASETARAAFGRTQIDAGITERTYLLQEWHAAFSQAGLDVQVLRVSDSFAAVYRKPDHAGRRPEPAGLREDLFAGFYRGRLAIAGDTPPRVAPGGVLEIPLLLENRANATWCSRSQFPVAASYHLYRVEPAGASLLSFDNLRTPLPAALDPGQAAAVVLRLDAPERPGDYAAEIDLVHEYVSWFAEKGLPSATVRFSVGDALQ